MQSAVHSVWDDAGVNVGSVVTCPTAVVMFMRFSKFVFHANVCVVTQDSRLLGPFNPQLASASALCCLWWYLKREKAYFNPFSGNFENLWAGYVCRRAVNHYWMLWKRAQSSDTLAWVVNCIFNKFSPLIFSIFLLHMMYRKIKSCSYAVLDRPRGIQEVEAPRILRQTVQEGGKVVSPTHRPPLPPGRIPGTHFC